MGKQRIGSLCGISGAKNEKILQIAAVGARLPRPMGWETQPLRIEQLGRVLGFTIPVQPNLRAVCTPMDVAWICLSKRSGIRGLRHTAYTYDS